MRGYLRSIAIAAGLVMIAGAAAADVQTRQFKVVGTFGNLTNWQKLEKPLWENTLPKASGGKLTAQAQPQTELGLKGFEIMRLLKQGIFDFAHALPIYVAEDAVLEGVDLAGVARDFATARKITEVYRPILQEAIAKQYGARILNMYPYPTQAFYCRSEVKGVQDLKGKKIRVQGASQGDFAEGLGATSVTIAFAEVVPALEKGVVDCGITGTMPAYKAKWYEVAKHAFYLPVGYTVAFTAVNLRTWNSLNKETQDLIAKELGAWEALAWKTIEAENDEGLACSTNGKCSQGPNGNITLVKPSDADFKAREKILTEVVLKRWAKRCGEACAKQWNDTVGKVVNLTASGS